MINTLIGVLKLQTTHWLYNQALLFEIVNVVNVEKQKPLIKIITLFKSSFLFDYNIHKLLYKAFTLSIYKARSIKISLEIITLKIWWAKIGKPSLL